VGESFQPLRGVSRIVVGEREIVVVHEAGADRGHKLSKEQRKARREDNKTMKLSRKRHRGAKKHGR
jgi:hypothetical protein